MSLYSNNDWWDYLSHHGIRGQKWGEKNGPPYPLDKQTSNSIKNGNNPSSYSSYPLSNPKTNDDYEQRELVLMDLQDNMKNIKYDFSDHTLKSPQQVQKNKSGNCHDQVLYELDYLKKLGFSDAKAKFLIEVDPKTGQGGTTHSFVYANKFNDGKPNDKVFWFENAWGGKEGFHEYDDMKSLMNDVEKQFKKASSNKNYSEILWGDFDPSVIKPGDSLQDIVDKCL